jgi:DNA-binding SARP family transcriptional activator
LLEVALLGEQYVEGSPATNLARSSRSVALLGFLAVHADAPQPRQRLAAIFWPDSTEQQARTNLRRELHHLRVLLGDDPSLVVEPATLTWREWPTCRVDVCMFRRERQLALRALAAGDHRAMLEHAAAAVEEYRGDLLPGMYDDWVLAKREQLSRQCVELCDQLIAGLRDEGDVKMAVEYGRIRVRLEPLEEVGYRTLMELQADAGDRAGAISTFHKCAEMLDRELQVKPSRATETLVEQLLSSDGLDMPRMRTPRDARTRLTGRRTGAITTGCARSRSATTRTTSSTSTRTSHPRPKGGAAAIPAFPEALQRAAQERADGARPDPAHGTGLSSTP